MVSDSALAKQIDIRDFAGVTEDSREVREGFLFAAFPGSRADGRAFLSDAVRLGAKALLVPAGTSIPDDVARSGIRILESATPRRLFALLAARFYGQQPARIVAVTGTNGKTSTVHFAKQLWTVLGHRAATIGTLGVRGAQTGVSLPGSMTTPGTVALHALLADLAAGGVTHLALEASSHGLHQYRLDGVRISAAGFTNLTRDHLDYHSGMEEYYAAKSRLFSEVMGDNGTAVLNADIVEFQTLDKLCAARGHQVISYGKMARHLRLVEAAPTPSGQRVTLELTGKRHEFLLPLVGSFQVMNALCALGLVMSEWPEDGARHEALIQALSRLGGVPGRLQPVAGHPRGAGIYIDYAHTPDALETVLKALRPHAQGRLVCLFGCGGDRDCGKRPIMGDIAGKYADSVIVTDDNPRSEVPSQIRRSILQAVPGAVEIAGRREAIQKAVTSLQEGDVLLIAGKGHEQGQIFADHTEPFDDFEEAVAAIGLAGGS